MISAEHINSLQGSTVVGADGERVGTVGQVLVDTATGAPEWVSVRTGLFGTHESLVPITDASLNSDELSVPFTKDQIKAAPQLAPDRDLSQDDEAQLYSHYGVNYSDAPSPSGLPTGRVDGRVEGRADVDGDIDKFAEQDAYAGNRNNNDAMTRSEEQLHVGTERVETGRARLRKYIETEEVNVPVTITKEKVRLEREPITDANRDRALDGPDITEGEYEVTLSEERPIVTKETVPVERVRLAKDVETEEVNVSETVRKERIETDGLVDAYPDERVITESERSDR